MPKGIGYGRKNTAAKTHTARGLKKTTKSKRKY
jgi:hypothetical protein